MDGLEPVGRVLLVVGIFIAVLGAVLILTPRVPFLGRLPGDLVIQRDGLTIYVPITTMLIVSVVLSLVLGLIGRNR